MSRRFRDFDWLQSRLQTEEKYRGCVYPILPSKKLLGNTTEDFVEKRRQELQLYLQMIGKHSQLKYDPSFRMFLTCESAEDFEHYKEDPRIGAEPSSIPLASLKRLQLQDTLSYICSSIRTKLFDKGEPEELRLGSRLEEVLDKIAHYVPFLEKSIAVLEEHLAYQKHFAASQETIAKALEGINDADPELEKTCQSVADYQSKYAGLIQVGRKLITTYRRRPTSTCAC